MVIHYNKQRRKYTVPFMMAPVNTRVVRRSNALLHHSYGMFLLATMLKLILNPDQPCSRSAAVTSAAVVEDKQRRRGTQKREGVNTKEKAHPSRETEQTNAITLNLSEA